MTGLPNPFRNDVFALAWKAFKNLYPDKDCVCKWADEIEPDENGSERYGATVFYDDGSVDVIVSTKLSVADAVEVFTHELAHVADGKDNEPHEESWEKHFDAIFEEYDRICNEMFPSEEISDETLS